jgi:hypothetical protein
MDDDSEIARRLRMATAATRRYASFFQWRSGDQETEEIGVVESLMESMAMCSAETLIALKSRGTGNDPPDCEAVTPDGRRVGIEVTELVDEAAIKEGIKRQRYFAYPYWDADKLREWIKGIVHCKDVLAKVKGGSYAEYWLVIHSDETALGFEETREWIGRMPELRTNLVSRAILMLSYRPEHRCCPYVDLPIRQEQRQHV